MARSGRPVHSQTTDPDQERNDAGVNGECHLESVPKRGLTFKEASHYSGLPIHFLRERVRKGDLPYYTAGQRWLIWRDDLDEFVRLKKRTKHERQTS